MAQARKTAALPIPAKPPVDAPGVVYAIAAAAPGLKLFECAPLRANLSQVGCATRWRTAQAATGQQAERFEACRSCSIGAAHAGERAVQYSWLYGQPICPRCKRGGFRMIGNRLCVGCYNRARELKAGKNGRGNVPVELMARQPRPHEFRMTVDGVASRQRVVAVDLEEAMIQALRVTKGELAFGFLGPTTMLRQGRLF